VTSQSLEDSNGLLRRYEIGLRRHEADRAFALHAPKHKQALIARRSVEAVELGMRTRVGKLEFLY
jgi:hypothetical protein